MKTIHTLKKISLCLASLLAVWSCERELSDDAELATFPKTGDIFTDNFVSMGTDFYFPFAGAKPDVFSVDNSEGFDSDVSIRFDVPNANDPTGNFAGAIFRSDAGARDLSDFDALTFYAKASQGVAIGEMGFGVDFLGDAYRVARSNVSLGTTWQKYIIPIPDASKLTQERGMFWFSAGTQDTGGNGYTFWIDELRFEKLGTIAQNRPAILNGEDATEDTFIGSTSPLTGLIHTANLGNGRDVTLQVAPSYFEFTSSDQGVATVGADGIVNVVGPSMSDNNGDLIPAVITATLGTDEEGNAIPAAGSLSLSSLGNFDPAPTPTRSPVNVISLFSDAYNNVPVDFFNGFWQPFQTTGSADVNINGDAILGYVDFNFVGTQFANPTVDATNMSHLHLDIFPREIGAGGQLKMTIRDFGGDSADGGGDDTNLEVNIPSADLTPNEWNTIEIPLTMAVKNNLGLIIYENLNTNFSSFLVDNLYFYTEPTSPTTAAPTPTQPAANVISLFSDAYTDEAVDTWRTPWSSGATVFTDEMVAGNAVKKYANLGVAGIETTTTTLDVSAMTHVHFDIWTPDASSFALKLVDFGPDNAFAGGDDTEHEVIVNPVANGQWVSVDLPLTDFVNLINRQNLAQYIIVAQPFEAADVYLDNFYFYN